MSVERVAEILGVDVEELKRRISQKAKERMAKAALEGESVEKKTEEKPVEKKELNNFEKERLELEKLRTALKGMQATSNGLRVVQMDKEIFQCPLCKCILRVKDGNDICVKCGIHFMY